MSKTFRATIGVLVLLAGGALVTACRSSSEKDQPKGATETAHSKVERAHAPRTERAASPAGEPATHVSSKATHAQAKAHAKAEPGSKEPAPTDPVSSMTP